MRRGTAPAARKGKTMEIVNRETGEFWTDVKVRDLRKIRKARKQGLTDRAATVAVLGHPQNLTATTEAPPADWW